MSRIDGDRLIEIGDRMIKIILDNGIVGRSPNIGFGKLRSTEYARRDQPRAGRDVSSPAAGARHSALSLAAAGATSGGEIGGAVTGGLAGAAVASFCSTLWIPSAASRPAAVFPAGSRLRANLKSASDLARSPLRS